LLRDEHTRFVLLIHDAMGLILLGPVLVIVAVVGVV